MNTTCFEGVEKKLDVILSDHGPDLREISNKTWERIVASCGANILSKIENDHLDAYLLSESSLFVWPRRILMITCGNTSLHRAANEVATLIAEEDASISYERMSFIHPQRQPSNFEDDVNSLSKIQRGMSYRFGAANSDHMHIFHSSQAPSGIIQPFTIQILMHGLSPDFSKIFFNCNTQSSTTAWQKSGLDNLYSEFKKDHYLFNPCGFSINGALDRNYFTMHISPELNNSYASFETNYLTVTTTNDAVKMLSIIKPSKFIIIIKSMNGMYNYDLNKLDIEYDLTEKISGELRTGHNIKMLSFNKSLIN